MKITKQTIKDIGIPERETWIWDSTLPGFGLRVWPSGRAVYVLRYRTSAGTQRKLTLGDARVMTPDEARDRARKAVVDARDGADPQRERDRRRNSETIADLCAAYTEHQKPHIKPTSRKALDVSFRCHIVPAFGKVKCSELTLEAVSKWHRQQRAQYAANKAIIHLSAALNWACDVMEWIPKNPIRKFRYYKGQKRQMILTPDQMRDLLAAIESTYTPRWAAPYLIKIIMITGLRLREWAAAEWWQYNDAAGTLTLPHEKSKTGARTVQLGEDARIMLRQIRSHPLASDTWIFPNMKADEPLLFPHPFWYKVIDKAGLKGLRIHDLRHTFASYSLMTGSTLKEVQEMLGHTQITTTSRYLGVFDEAVQRAQTRSARAILNVALTGHLPGGDTASRQPLTVAM